MMACGILQATDKGNPQGGPISLIPANISWMSRTRIWSDEDYRLFAIQFVRYADDFELREIGAGRAVDHGIDHGVTWGRAAILAQ